MGEKILAGYYQINGFTSIRRAKMGDMGFSASLAGPLVDAFLKLKRDEKVPLFKELYEIGKQTFPRDKGGIHLRFHEDTWLLKSIKVSGDCACFFIDGSNLDFVEEGNDSVRYHPHNVDTLEQEACILAIWLHWFNHVIYLTEYRLPMAF